jgi:hypothetical protein
LLLFLFRTMSDIVLAASAVAAPVVLVLEGNWQEENGNVACKRGETLLRNAVGPEARKHPGPAT